MPHPRHAAFRLPLCLCALALSFALLAPAARAAERENYQLAPIGAVGCMSGQADQRGTLYLPCRGRVRMYNTAGRFLGQAGPALGDVTDVAPSPDGRFIYFGATHRPVGRLVRVRGRRYVLDQRWRLASFPWGGSMQTAYTSHLATDARGDIYVSDGGWTANLLNIVLKFESSGKLITSFGAYSDGDGSRRNASGVQTDPRLWQVGQFYWMLAGVAASADGRRVYTTEVGNNRVTIWRQTPGGSYRASGTFGSTPASDPRREGSCADGAMAAPYDVGIDPWGYVYITNATCTQVQKFTAGGHFVYSAFNGSNGLSGPGGSEANRQRSHSLAIDAAGNIWSGEVGHKLVRPAGSTPTRVPGLGIGEPTPTTPTPAPPAPVAPQPPAAAGPVPVMQSVSLPSTTRTSQITVHVAASDDVGVTQMRMASENGDDWTAWQPFQTSFLYTLNAGVGYRGVFVEVRDADGNESAPMYATTNMTG